LEPYDCLRFSHFHHLIDTEVSLSSQISEEGGLIIEVKLPAGDTLRLQVEASRLLYQLDRDAYIEALNAARNAVQPVTAPTIDNEE